MDIINQMRSPQEQWTTWSDARPHFHKIPSKFESWIHKYWSLLMHPFLSNYIGSPSFVYANYHKNNMNYIHLNANMGMIGISLFLIQLKMRITHMGLIPRWWMVDGRKINERHIVAQLWLDKNLHLVLFSMNIFESLRKALRDIINNDWKAKPKIN